MRANSLKTSMLGWYRGLIPLALIWVATPLALTGPIERDLTTRTSAVSGENPAQPAQWVTIQIDGRDAVAEGMAPSASAKAGLSAVVQSVPGVRMVADRTWPLTVASPFQWNAVSDGSQLILTGYVPPSGQRTELIKQAQTAFPWLRVSDNMTEADGAPAAFHDFAAFALTALKPLSTGTVELIGTQFSIRGAAPTEAAYNTVLSATRSLPQPLTLNVVDVTVPPAAVPVETASINPKPIPPYVWIASHDGKEIALTGAVPNQDTRQKLLAAASRSFTNLSVRDKMSEQADGVPEGFIPAAELALVQLARLEAGSAAITDQKLNLIGLAPSEDIVEQTTTAVATLSGTIAATTSVVARPKVDVAVPAATATDQACAASLTELAAERRIKFNSRSWSIASASLKSLNQLAVKLKSCPSVKVEVGGHTDSTGDPEINLALSSRRAAAVAEALELAGVEKDRLTAKGFGAANPVARNTSKVGRAANRRIELVVVR